MERPTGRDGGGLMKLSTGSRSFLRYGYGDLLKENRRYGIITRIWPGTQRLLIWGDPLTAAAYSRAFSFCGSDGAEFMEPLSFKGRRGSGIAGDRCAYADASLKPKWDWEKYLYTFRVWGRMLYNPDSDPGRLATRVAKGFRTRRRRPPNSPSPTPAASCPSSPPRICPPPPTTITGRRCISTNRSSMRGRTKPYSDTPAPKVFGNVSPARPAIVSAHQRFCGRTHQRPTQRQIHARRSRPMDWRITPTPRRKTWRNSNARRATKPRPNTAAWTVDLKIQIGLGRFFGAKFRAGVIYGIFEKTGDAGALAEAIKAYKQARAAWAEIADVSRNVYMTDVTIGELPQLRGHWADRLPAIDRDIAAMEEKTSHTPERQVSNIKPLILAVIGHPNRKAITAHHTQSASFHPGQSMEIELSVEKSPQTVRMYYRHVNQGERWQSAPMQANGNKLPGLHPRRLHRLPLPAPILF